MSSKEAQLLAKEQGVDLVEIAANANPPVVKIIDWGKYQYQKMKELLVLLILATMILSLFTPASSWSVRASTPNNAIL